MTSEYELHLPEQTSVEPWCEDLAKRLAKGHGLERLTPAHWCVIQSLREHFIQYGAMPPMRAVCDHNRLEPHCVNDLFHDPETAWRIAGLPDPGEEARSYLYPDDQVQH